MNHSNDAGPSTCMLWLLLRRLQAYEPGLAQMVQDFVNASHFNAKKAETVVVLTGAADGVSAVAISPDGSTVAGSGFDSCIRIWENVTAASSGGSVGKTSLSFQCIYITRVGSDGRVGTATKVCYQ